MLNKLIIVVGPSGAGKSSFVEKAVGDLPFLVDVITCTTRSMRAGEREGYPYHFMTNEEFQEKIQAGFFVEYAKEGPDEKLLAPKLLKKILKRAG